MSKAAKDANAVVLTDEVRQAIEGGAAVRTFIPLSMIRYGNNPRKRKGFDPESMRELAESIALDGLLKNVLVRQIEGEDGSTFYEIVAGERRTRAIRSLVEEDRMVLDQTTGKMAPASKVYDQVPALIQGGCDDNRATTLSFLENDQHVPLSDADVIDLCVALENGGKTRKEISDLLRKSQAWLCHTFGFVSRLTPENYERLRSGQINRSVAVKLMEFAPEVQAPIIEAAKEIATERHKATKAKADKEFEEATENVDKAFREKINIARQKNADDRARKAAEQKVESAEKKVRKAAERKTQVDQMTPTPSQSDVAEGAFRVIGAVQGKGLNPAQIREHYTERAKTLLAIGDGGDPLDTETGRHFLRHDLELVSLVSEAIATGDRDFTGVLRQFYTSSGTWNADGSLCAGRLTPRPDDEADDDDDDDEDEDFSDLNWDDESPVAASVFAGIDLDSDEDADDEDI